MAIDVGKDAKRAGRERPRDARKRDQDPARLPPHKKPRDYVLTVEWREEQVIRRTMKFPSKDSREQAKLRVQRELKEKIWMSWSAWNEERLFKVKEGPAFIESMNEVKP